MEERAAACGARLGAREIPHRLAGGERRGEADGGAMPCRGGSSDGSHEGHDAGAGRDDRGALREPRAPCDRRESRDHDDGAIEAVRGCHVFPDTVVVGAGENPQWLYTVAFSGRELWGEEADPTLTVSIDAFEPYLERA